MQDEALINRVLKGDQSAFEEIILVHQHAIYGYLRARLLQASDADDLVQEVFLRFYLARARVDTAQLVRPWLLGIARNVLKEHLRKVRRHREVGWTELCLELEDWLRVDHSQQDNVLTHLPGCLDGLGQSARQAIQMHYSDNLRLSQIGERLHRSEGAIKLLVFRARQALKRCLTDKLQSAT